jgi:murein DD-endopeptidase MepM/ murein hydrolase activator NlpD
MCGAAVGCSRGMDGLTDGLVTNSTNSYASQQVVRPQVPVGGGYGTIAAEPQQLPPPTSVAAAPVSPVYTSQVSSAPLPPPQNSGSWQSAPQAPQQVAAASSNVMSAPAPMAPAPQPQQSAAQAGGSYVVASGDTLYGIARKTGVSATALQQANGLSSPDSIRIGQRLTIPAGGTAPTTTIAAAPATPSPQPASLSAPTPKPQPTTVAAPPTAQPVKAAADEKPVTVAAYTPPATSQSDVAEKSTEVAALPPESTGVGRLRWPVQGRIVAQFGGGSGGKGNDGIDIAVPEGTSVRAAENGVVIYAGDGLKGFGNTVLVRHEDGLVTVYGHASQLKVKRGDQIKRGQELALSGMTGEADRPKLHFEVRKGTSPVNPMTYLN